MIKPPLYICRSMPGVSQNLPTSENLEQDVPIDLNLCQCSGCGLVQFDCEPVSYYKDSTRAGERCEALIALRQNQYKHLIETYHLQKKKILEVGAGKGGSFAYPARLIDPNTMLQCVFNSLVEDGVGLIMVPSMEHLLSSEGFFDIVRDHIAYYSEDTLRFLLQKNGFDVLEHGEVFDFRTNLCR